MPSSNNLTAEQQMLMARQLRQEQKAAIENQVAESGSDGRPQKQIRVKEKISQKAVAKVAAPAREGINWMLRMAWFALIPSFGLTLFYIDLHVFLRLVLGDRLFCKLGQEWIPRQAQAVGGEVGKTAGLVEVGLLIFLNLLFLTLIASVLAILVVIINFWESSFAEKIWGIWKAIDVLGWGAVSALKSLFDF